MMPEIKVTAWLLTITIECWKCGEVFTLFRGGDDNKICVHLESELRRRQKHLKPNRS